MAELITQEDANRLNRQNVDMQRMQFGTQFLGLSTGSAAVTEVEIIDDATGGVSIPVPADMEIVEIIVQSRATSAGGTATVRSGTNAISNAMVMAVDNTMARAGTIDRTYSTITTDTDLNVVTANAADRGLITIIGKRS